MGTGQVTYRLSDLEFVTAHIAIRPFLSPPYHENIFTGCAFGGHLGGCPILDDYAMPTTSGAPLSFCDMLLCALDCRGDEQSPSGSW